MQHDARDTHVGAMAVAVAVIVVAASMIVCPGIQGLVGVPSAVDMLVGIRLRDKLR